MKRIFYIVLALFVFACAQTFAEGIFEPYVPAKNEIIFNEATYDIDVIDPVAATNWRGINYPGLRGTNQLIVYSSAFGDRTGTNEFGTEAVIEGNIVTSLSGADSLIPANGFVISGHGRAKKWINENVIVGSKIYIDTENKKITSYITSASFLYSAQERIKEVQDMMAYYIMHSQNYNTRKTELNLNKARDYVEKAQNNAEDSQKYSSKAIEYADNAMATVVPFKASELKGVWIRPEYYNKKSIEEVLDNVASNGINNIFIETYYHGKTIYPSRVMDRYGFVKQYEDFEGFDPLRIWISEAHKRGIKVHIWFQTYYVGNKPPETNPKYILAVHPEWANYQKRNADSGSIAYSVSEHNGYFLDPANPEVQTFLYELLCEIVNKYKPDGINLDYIRYPQSLSSNYPNYDMSNWGYTNYARNDFKSIYGRDPIDIKTTDALWSYWRYYRAGKVTEFVRKTCSLCHSNRVMLTAVIFPNRSVAMDTKLQDWKQWSISNLVDGFTPLLLTSDDKTASSLIEEVLRNKQPNTKLYAGLFVAFMNGANTDLIKQIHATRKYGLNGLIIFDYAHLNDTYLNSLTQSIFRQYRKYNLSEEDERKYESMNEFKSRKK